MSRGWDVRLEYWPYRRAFIIARGALLEAANLVVEVSEGSFRGRGECEPHESDFAIAEQVYELTRKFLSRYGSDLTRASLAEALPAGAMRNAIDCALWDLEAKRAGVSAAELAGLVLPEWLPTTGTVSFDAPQIMAVEAAEKTASASVLKIKLGGERAIDLSRIHAVRAAVPNARLIVDANGGWDVAALKALAPVMAELGVEMIEQPLPPGADAQVADVASPVPLCADESVTDTASLSGLPNGYAMINIKLDKCGGLTEGLALARSAVSQGLNFMVGSNGGTSLAAAPAYLLAAGARYADIDSPLLLARDRIPGLTFASGLVGRPPAALWG